MTFDQLEKAGFVEHHRCGACNGPVGYQVHPEMAAAVYDSGCDCAGGGPNYRLLTRRELDEIPAPDASAAAQQEPRQ